MSKWKQELRDKLEVDLETKMYYIGDNVYLNKQEYIELMIKIEGRARKHRDKHGKFNTGTD